MVETREHKSEKDQFISRRSRARRVAAEKRRKRIIFLVVIIAILCFFGWYMIFCVRDSFAKGSMINGIDVSGMNAKEASKTIENIWSSKKLQVNGPEGLQGVIDYSTLEFNAYNQVKDQLNPGFAENLRRTFDKEKRKIEIPIKPMRKTPAFMNQVNMFPAVINGAGTVKTKSAYVDISDRKFKIVKEVYGNNLDKPKLIRAMFKAVSKGQEQFDYSPEKFYKKPRYTENSRKVIKRKAYCHKYLSTEITLKGPLRDYTVEPEDLDKMMSVKNGEIITDSKAIKNYVDNKLCYAINSRGARRKLRSAGGGTYYVEGGDYGYSIDNNKEKLELAKDIRRGRSITRNPIYSKEGAGKKQGNDIGDNYVEISIGRQHLWCVIKGKTVVSSGIVTGNVAKGHATPMGVFSLSYKASDAKLEGNNDDGSSYETKVSYWMPFNGGIGMHDATWRNKFGGSIYTSNGSHGCVNMPKGAAGSLYSKAYAGMPVIVHR